MFLDLKSATQNIDQSYFSDVSFAYGSHDITFSLSYSHNYSFFSDTFL